MQVRNVADAIMSHETRHGITAVKRGNAVAMAIQYNITRP